MLMVMILLAIISFLVEYIDSISIFCFAFAVVIEVFMLRFVCVSVMRFCKNIF